MEFKKYNSITNHYDAVFINKIRALNYNGAWYVSEKIHGANCQITYDEEGFKIGCRNSFIDDNIWYEVLGKYKNNLEQLVKNKGWKDAVIFGEFFGGTYPHIDVPKSKHARRVQKGVYYTPENEVLFYDLYLADEDKYISVEDFMSLMDEYNIPRVNFIKYKSLEQALACPNDNPSHIYVRYGLPKIEDNIEEGIVIKPNDTLWAGQSRAIIKSKNDRFKEVAHARKKLIVVKELDEKLQTILNKALKYVTENRVNNILSHYGTEVNFTIIGSVLKEMNLDVLEAFESENNDFNMLEKAEIKEITHKINSEIAKIVKAVIIEKMKDL